MRFATETRGAAMDLLFAAMEAAAPTGPVFVTGDFNEPSGLDWTEAAVAAGLHPIPWTGRRPARHGGGVHRCLSRRAPRPGGPPAFTWTPMYPEDATDDHPDRIDFVFVRGATVTDAWIVGETDPDRSSGGSLAIGSSRRAGRGAVLGRRVAPRHTPCRGLAPDPRLGTNGAWNTPPFPHGLKAPPALSPSPQGGCRRYRHPWRQLVNVQSREILDGWQVAIAAGRFAYVGPDASHCIGPDTEVIEAQGRYLIPGLCDGHMHIESGQLTPADLPPPSSRMARRRCSPTRTRSPTCWPRRRADDA